MFDVLGDGCLLDAQLLKVATTTVAILSLLDDSFFEGPNLLPLSVESALCFEGVLFS